MEGGGDDDHAAAAAVVIEHKAYARVGLLGNPSDVYYGNTIAFSISNFFATVKLIPSIELIIQPHPTHDLVNFSSNHQLVYFSLSFSFACPSFVLIIIIYVL